MNFESEIKILKERINNLEREIEDKNNQIREINALTIELKTLISLIEYEKPNLFRRILKKVKGGVK